MRTAPALLAAFSLLCLAACNDRLFDNPYDPDAQPSAYEILGTLQVSGIAPVDLAFSGDALWVVDDFSRIQALNPNTGAVIRELDPEVEANGICYDGSDLWLTTKNSTQIVKISIINGEILRVLDLTRGRFAAIDFYSGRLYICDQLSNSILQVDSETGTVERTMANPGFSLDGVTFDGSSLWTIDASQIKIFRLNADGGVTSVYQTPARSPSALASDSGFIWCGDRSQRIYKLRFP